jgi:hypothetical protein
MAEKMQEAEAKPEPKTEPAADRGTMFPPSQSEALQEIITQIKDAIVDSKTLAELSTAEEMMAANKVALGDLPYADLTALAERRFEELTAKPAKAKKAK